MPFLFHSRLQRDGPIPETLTGDEEKKAPMLHVQHPHKVAELPITEVRRPASDSQVRIRRVVANQATAGCFSWVRKWRTVTATALILKATSCSISANSREHPFMVWPSPAGFVMDAKAVVQKI